MNNASHVIVPRPSRIWRRLRLTLGIVVSTVLITTVAAGVWTDHELSASLPQLEGTRVLPGLSGAVRVQRDGLGIPTISGSTRADVARATGFVHAQDRFFQMDLSRRQAAGELSALIGRQTVEADKAARLHRLRARATLVVAAASTDERALLTAYADGVNAGLQALATPPFEYLLLRASPAPWQPEDSVLVLASMFFSLQDSTAGRESRVALTEDVLPPALSSFLLAPARDWEAPNIGEPSPPVALPGPAIVDLRKVPLAPLPQSRLVPDEVDRAPDTLAALGVAGLSQASWNGDEELRGSNNWALSGAHTANGAALVADDMHLRIAVPNTWYRASLEWSDAGGPHRITGVTLPGVPNVVVGSNATLAWGFTNVTGDFSDLVLIEPDPASPDRYLTPSGPQAFAHHAERITVKGGADEVLDVTETVWGPVIDTDHQGRTRAVCWVPARPDGMNFRLLGFETATSIEGAFALAHGAGIPAQNLVVGDRNGRIAWTVVGRVPRRVGFDGRVPVSWADGSRRWDGWLDSDAYPRIVDPPSGRLWTANNRTVDGDMLRVLGDGGFDLGARAKQIRDDLMAVERATPADMLKIQLDDRALFLSRWRDLALRTLTSPAIATSTSRQEFRRLVEQTWSGRASVESAGYRLVRAFRLEVAKLALEPLLAPAIKADRRPGATAAGWVRSAESPLWTVVSEQPPHLLDPKYSTWSDLLLDAVDRTCASLTSEGGTLSDRTWGEVNTARIAHPLSAAIPFVGRWLNMPPEPLPGDSHMPRVQAAASGASERFAVSPGHEQDGYFHMPGGQSGHPMSPHYRDGHDAWVRGEPTPFLPGPRVNQLMLEPR
jgi:penicillin G amidase